jgi:L,D-peptidoglycan transpeptidase YkuD (ErfK/YbiS/YcfS/YnhG family)
VFVHLARPRFGPTAGCIALTPASLRRLLSQLYQQTRIDVGG